MVLVEAQSACVCPVIIHAEKIGYRITTAHAGNALEDAGGPENNPVVGQIAGVVIIHIRLFAGRNLAQV